MEWDQFREIFADSVEGVAADALRQDTAYKQLLNWDSLAVLTLIDSIDDATGVLLRKSDFEQSDTLGDLYASVCRG